jgi:hypothetical protein
MQCDLGESTIFYETYGAGRPIVMLPVPGPHARVAGSGGGMRHRLTAHVVNLGSPWCLQSRELAGCATQSGFPGPRGSEGES